MLSHLTDQESREDNFELPLFDLATIATATNNFCNTNRVGSGGFGSVYKVICAHGMRLCKPKRISVEIRMEKYLHLI